MNNKDEFEIISIYIDARDSTKMESDKKIEMIKSLYNQFKNFNGCIKLNNISKTGDTLFSGDAIILNYKTGELNEELVTLLKEIEEKTKNISNDEFVFGIGIAYGWARSYNINNEKTTMIGTVVDLAAKSSNISMKNNDYLFTTFIKNKANDIDSGLNNELVEFIQEKTDFESKKTSSGGSLKFKFVQKN